jgi:hypothetical protein
MRGKGKRWIPCFACMHSILSHVAPASPSSLSRAFPDETRPLARNDRESGNDPIMVSPGRGSACTSAGSVSPRRFELLHTQNEHCTFVVCRNNDTVL